MDGEFQSITLSSVCLPPGDLLREWVRQKGKNHHGTFVDVCVGLGKQLYYNVMYFRSPTLLLGAQLQRLWPIQGSRERGCLCCYSILLALDIANTKFTEKEGLWLQGILNITQSSLLFLVCPTLYFNNNCCHC